MRLTRELLVRAYRAGAFPLACGRRGAIDWYSPDPRALLPIDGERFHVPRSLARRVRSGRFTVTFDRAFDRVIRACAAPRPGEPGTWISDEIITAYTALHRSGLAHSIEAWIGEPARSGPSVADALRSGLRGAADSDAKGEPVLAGGLYGVALGGAFFGESMFSRRTDASKVCLVKLVKHLRQQGFVLLDAQFHNRHLEQFGLYEVRRTEYLRQLGEALALGPRWPAAAEGSAMGGNAPGGVGVERDGHG